ncbi:MAG: hypothetical protein R3E08_12210 [Thiotrichaceae bacterium]
MNEVIIDSPQPRPPPVIWLHGLNADGHDFEALVITARSYSKRLVLFSSCAAPSLQLTV